MYMYTHTRVLISICLERIFQTNSERGNKKTLSASMSVKKTFSLTRWETKKTAAAPTKVKKARSLASSSEASEHAHSREVAGSPKKPRKDSGRRFSFGREVTIEPEGARSLEEVDSGKLKAEILRWARTVASYARQVSSRIRRSVTMSSSSHRSSNIGDGHVMKAASR